MIRASVIFCLLGLFWLARAVGADNPPPEVSADGTIEWGVLWMTLFGGLAMFLAGMDLMSDSLKAVAGKGLKVFLSKMTANRFLGAISGAFITAILNSSSVTTVLVVGFISAGLMTLQQTIGIIMGANIGSTMTAQIVAFNITQYALLPVAIGFAMRFVSREERIRYYGGIIMGLGLIFYGMGLMGDAMAPLRTYEPFQALMVKMADPLLGVLVGALFTALVQSSAATTGIAITMAAGGLITLEAGVALALGSNIGTCATALLAAIGKPRPALQTAMAHVMFNVLGVLLWVFMIPVLCGWVRDLSPSYPELEGVARMSAEVPRQIANAHTLFNVANTAIFICFTTQFARFIKWIVPDLPPQSELIVQAKYLDEELIATPGLALERVRMEVGHLGEVTQEMFIRFNNATWRTETSSLEELVRMDDRVDILSEKILHYLASLDREKLDDADGRELLSLMVATDTIESVGDVFENEIVDTMRRAREYDVRASKTMQELMENLYATVQEAFHLSVKSVVEKDETSAQEVLSMKSKVKNEIDRALSHQAKHLTLEDENRLHIFRVEMEFVESMKRLYSFSKRIAKLSLPKEMVTSGL